MDLHPSDSAARSEAWSEFYSKYSPRNEEAFYICFKFAWAEAQKYYERRVSLLEQEVAWAERGYTADAKTKEELKKVLQAIREEHYATAEVLLEEILK